jgi:hypothetical protein
MLYIWKIIKVGFRWRNILLDSENFSFIFTSDNVVMVLNNEFIRVQIGYFMTLGSLFFNKEILENGI